MQGRSWDDWLELVDWPAAIRGAGTGFGVLVITTLVQPILEQYGPWLPPLVLIVGYLLGFTLAARGAGEAPSPALTGAVAGLLAYTLTLPLLYISRKPMGWDVLWSCLGYCVAGLVVGGLVGHLAGRRQAASD
jgi:hypothetical protein